MRNYVKVIPGVALCVTIMLLGIFLANWLGKGINLLQGLPSKSSSPVSSMFVAIILGLLIRNLVGLKEIFKDGISFSIKFLLRLGIILIGIRLSLMDVITVGAWGIPIILTCIIAGLALTMWITNRLKQSQRLGTLIAVGTGICGITAIMGTAPGIKANDQEVAYAVANVTIFGLIAMFMYPYLAFYIFQNDPVKVGLFLGTAIHDTSQVIGAALMYDQMYDMPQVVGAATITKLTRNFFLVAAVPLISYYYYKKIGNDQEGDMAAQPKWYTLVPLFVFGFIAMSIVRTIGDSGVANHGLAFGLLDPLVWRDIWSTMNTVGSNYLIGTAMAGVGLSTSLSVIRGLGRKPFYLGMAAALSVSVISLVMILCLGPFIIL